MKIPVRMVAVAVAFAAAVVTVIARRPVKPPTTQGSWLPADRLPTHL